jgi:hypothetical protein
MATLKERVDEHDREIAAIRKLLLTGMKMLVRLEQSQKRLEAAQKETDRMLKDLIRSLGRNGGGNGHRRTRLS